MPHFQKDKEVHSFSKFTDAKWFEDHCLTGRKSVLFRAASQGGVSLHMSMHKPAPNNIH